METIDREGGIQRDVCPPCLHDREQRDHKVGGTLHANSHEFAWPNAHFAQPRRQPVGARVQLGVGQSIVLADHGGGIRRGCSLLLHELVRMQVREWRGRRIPLVQQGFPLNPVEHVEHRQRLLNDAGYVARFRRDWRAGKEGFNLNRLRHWLKMESTTFSRELDDMVVERAPIALWSGQRLGEVYRRLRSFQQGDRRIAASSEEDGFFAAAPPINDDADFMLHLLRQFDRALRWYVITANQRPEVLRELLFDPQTLPGFNDSGAHLTNMAYFDGNLSTLKMAAQESLDQVSLAVKRLTRDPARLFRMEVGTLEMAAQADLILVDPQALLDYDSDAGLTMIHREVFDHPQLVNRSDGVVDKVWIAGKLAWDGATFTPEVGKERFGRLMTARAQTAA